LTSGQLFELDGSIEGEPNKGLTASELGTGIYFLVAIVCNIFPTLARQLFPGGEIPDDGQTAFLTIYLTTLPLSLALTAVIFIWLKQEFDTDQERLFISAVIMIVSGIVGLGLGTSLADQEFLSQVHGPGWAMLAQVVAYVLFSYALFYGWALFIAAFVTSAIAGFWLHEKVT
jgi:hypothetical protein